MKCCCFRFPHAVSFHPGRLSSIALAMMVCPLVMVGCSTPQQNAAAELDRGAARVEVNDAEREFAPGEERAEARRIRHAAIDELEQQYVIGPMMAREMGYRIDWQYPDAGERMKILKVQDDAVFALDGRNFLTRLDRDSGSRLWRLPIAEPILEIFGLTYDISRERLYAMSGGAVLEMDSVSGSQVGRQRLEKIANTAPAVFGPHLVYGSRNGQLIWHSYTVAYQWRAYQISRSIRIAPVISDGVSITIGVDGRVAALDVREARMLWSQQLLGRVNAAPAVGDGGVFVAGTDQHLWAFDLFSGRPIWRHLTERPLNQPPTLIDNHVYQHVPDRGLVCFEAFPLDQPGGRIIWENENVVGNVIGQRRNRLLVWDQAGRKLTFVDARRGGVIETFHLPAVSMLRLSRVEADEIFAVDARGRVQRLIARN